MSPSKVEPIEGMVNDMARRWHGTQVVPTTWAFGADQVGSDSTGRYQLTRPLRPRRYELVRDGLQNQVPSRLPSSEQPCRLLQTRTTLIRQGAE